MPKTNTLAIKANLYPLVEKSLKNTKPFEKVVTAFLNDRHDALFNTMPLDRIYYREEDKQLLLSSLGISESFVSNVIANTYYGEISSFNPRAAKDPVTIVILNMVRYFYLKRDKKRLELALVYLSFSGKFYPSIHYMAFPKVVPQDYVMEYVLNNMMDKKFGLKSKGSVFGAVLSTAQVWLTTYQSKFNSFSDDDAVYLIQQLHTRLKTFMKNIAKLYYKAYKDKDYITYNSDSEDPDKPEEYHLANNDSFVAIKSIDKAMTFITRNTVDYKICKLASNKNVKTEEVKAIMETIITDTDNIPDIRKVVSTMVYSYFATNPREKTVVSSDFLVYSVTPKPNSTDKSLIELRKQIETWLSTGSASYRRRYKRVATRLSYNKAVLTYFAMVIYYANK